MNKSAAKQSGAMDEKQKKKEKERKESPKLLFMLLFATATEVCDRSMRFAQLTLLKVESKDEVRSFASLLCRIGVPFVDQPQPQLDARCNTRLTRRNTRTPRAYTPGPRIFAIISVGRYKPHLLKNKAGSWADDGDH
jgi:hypothetical protein